MPVNEFFKWLSSNPVAATALIAAVGLIVIAIVLTYLIALFQGREISFWPPKIGGKSTSTQQAEKPRGSSSSQFENELKKYLI